MPSGEGEEPGYVSPADLEEEIRNDPDHGEEEPLSFNLHWFVWLFNESHYFFENLGNVDID